MRLEIEFRELTEAFDIPRSLQDVGSGDSMRNYNWLERPSYQVESLVGSIDIRKGFEALISRLITGECLSAAILRGFDPAPVLGVISYACCFGMIRIILKSLRCHAWEIPTA